jgi:hypothetical protein
LPVVNDGQVPFGLLDAQVGRRAQARQRDDDGDRQQEEAAQRIEVDEAADAAEAPALGKPDRHPHGDAQRRDAGQRGDGAERPRARSEGRGDRARQRQAHHERDERRHSLSLRSSGALASAS